MRGLFDRALVAAAAGVAMLAIAAPSVAFASNANESAISAPVSRLPASFSLDLPALMPSLSSGPQDLSRYATDEVDGEFVLFEGVSIDTGFNVDVARLLDRFAPASSAFDGLFYSAAALNQSYASISSGGKYVGMTLALADTLHLTIGQASSSPGLNPYLLNPHWAVARLGGAGLPYDTRNTRSLLAGITWNFAKWGGINFTASQTTERDGTLSDNDSGVSAARTSALAVSARVGFGGGWVTSASYSEGDTQLDLKPGVMLSTSSMRTQSYGIAVAKHGLFGNDALGVAFSRPAPSFGSSFTPTATTGDMQFFGRDKLFAGAMPETDIELGYVTNFFGNSVALQANASYQTNFFGGQNGTNAVSLLSRAKIKF